MKGKSACGNCGSKAGCGCSTPNPYEQSVQVVWHDPTDYNVTKHGPSFLPKLASAQKAEVKAFLQRKAAYYDTFPTDAFQRQENLSPLGAVVTFLRAMAHVHQSHHWQTHGTAYYADHLLFERLYNESLEFVDQVAERAVGIDGMAAVDPFLQATGISLVVAHACGHHQGDRNPSSLEVSTPDLMVERSLRGEVTLLKLVTMVIQALERAGKLTPGTSNLLEGVADKHEVFVYLLQQRLGGGHPVAGTYSYDRG